MYFSINMIERDCRIWCKGMDKKVSLSDLNGPYRIGNSFFFRWRVCLTSVTVNDIFWCFWICFINIFFNGAGGVIIKALPRLRDLFFFSPFSFLKFVPTYFNNLFRSRYSQPWCRAVIFNRNICQTILIYQNLFYMFISKYT